MARVLLAALITGVAVIGVAGTSGQTATGPSDRATTTGAPFLLNGEMGIRGSSGWDGDRSRPGQPGMRLGCLAGRHYAFAVTVGNRTGKAVTLTGARGPNPAPRVIDPVAIQLRLAPLPPTGDQLVPPLIRQWSSSRSRPVRVPPGRVAVVQSNFLMRRCAGIAQGRMISVPGWLVLRYSASSHTGAQRVVQPDAGFVLVPGPTIRA